MRARAVHLRCRQRPHTYAYGRGTIPYEIGDFTQHSSLGVTPTFATDSAGNWQDIKFGSDAEILPQDRTFNGMTAYDRDPFGYVAVQRNSSGTSAWTVPNLYSGCDTQNAGDAAPASSGFTGTAFNSCLSNGLLYQYRTDGYYDGALTFRGVRTYDSSTQQWSTPDAYAGNPANPISSLGYNYAGNNPAMFADPSGFCSFSSNNSGLATIAQGCADGAGDLSWCVIGCYGDDPLGPDGMPADWQLGYFKDPGACHRNVPVILPPVPGLVSDAFLSGARNSLKSTGGLFNPATKAAAAANVGRGGTFDVQRWNAPPLVQFYVDGSNFITGVYMNGAGFNKAEMLIAGTLYAMSGSEHPLSVIAHDLPLWIQGWDWAQKACRGK